MARFTGEHPPQTARVLRVANLDSDMTGDRRSTRLRDAVRQARIEAADRSAVVVDLRDAEVARLEILNEALDPLFSEVPANVDLFDRGISRGDTPRLWIDVVAHVVMGRDKRIYRFVQDSRFGRVVLAESHDVKPIVSAVTDYVARRMIEREHALVTTTLPVPPAAAPVAAVAAPAAAAAPKPAPTPLPPRRARKGLWMFVLGFFAGMAALFGIALLAALRGM
jgi:hypothetical protein